MSSPTLLVLAAGLGSRYGGIKQMDPVGPCGEFVLDYSIYDAWRAGFAEAVLVIREEHEEPLRQHFGTRLDGRIRVTYSCQRLDDLPPGFALPPGRQRPWGTGHAVWSARAAVRTSFGMINADDFYGAAAYGTLAEFLRGPRHDACTYAMVAYRLSNTLSRYGSVSRGICSRDAEGFLLEVIERTKIEMSERGARYLGEDGAWGHLSGD
jgi:UTP-glucose-1-phosphate uridylyltransferase